MQEYISKQHRILRPAEQIYAVISRFDNLTPGRRRPGRGVAGHRGHLFVQGQRLHRPVSAWRSAMRTAPRQDRGRRRGNADGFRLLDSAPQSLRHRHPHAAGAAHRAEHDDEDDDRRQAPGRTWTRSPKASPSAMNARRRRTPDCRGDPRPTGLRSRPLHCAA